MTLYMALAGFAIFAYVAVMSGATVTMMLVAAREPSAAAMVSTPQQSSAAVVAGESAARWQAGEQLFQELGCAGCHRPDGAGSGPALDGLSGRPLADAGCGVTTADDEYVRESILNPTATVVAGFAPVMPSFAGRVTDEQLWSLTAYVKSLRAR